MKLKLIELRGTNEDTSIPKVLCTYCPRENEK